MLFNFVEVRLVLDRWTSFAFECRGVQGLICILQGSQLQKINWVSLGWFTFVFNVEAAPKDVSSPKKWREKFVKRNQATTVALGMAGVAWFHVLCPFWSGALAVKISENTNESIWGVENSECRSGHSNRRRWFGSYPRLPVRFLNEVWLNVNQSEMFRRWCDLYNGCCT